MNNSASGNPSLKSEKKMANAVDKHERKTYMRRFKERASARQNNATAPKTTVIGGRKNPVISVCSKEDIVAHRFMIELYMKSINLHKQSG